MTAIVQRLRGRKQRCSLISFFSICEVVQYYLKVDCAQLQMNVVNARKNTKKKTKEVQLTKQYWRQNRILKILNLKEGENNIEQI